jgi:anhydro-N-acetylmuramic acid kinase
MIVAGIMSGTSLDGIDVAIVEIRGAKFQVLAHATTPYSSKVRAGLLSISNCETHTARIAKWNFRLAELYAAAVKRLWTKPLDLVGCHGQTIYHSRDCTLQIGNGSVLAERLGAPVVSDFRPRDMAAGGRGAPLVPFFDYRLLRHRTIARAALNIGGIANVTIIPAGAKLDDVLAFDTGPGNMVIDQLVARMKSGRFDRGGRIAMRGKLDERLLANLLRDPYLRAKPPKTAGREQYGTQFADRFPANADGVRTAAAFTAATIAEGIRRFGGGTRELVAAGGGVHNPVLMGYLAGFLPHVRIRTMDDFGVSADAKEAVAFAILAAETAAGRPSNVPSATGARRAVVLGGIAP